jgi:hypothetical protein
VVTKAEKVTICSPFEHPLTLAGKRQKRSTGDGTFKLTLDSRMVV